jgi:hypothetical protein
MTRTKPATAIEKISGHVTTESALALIGALSGNPLAALLPVLGKSLASERQKKRVEVALLEVNQLLESHEKALRDLNDAQYKLINETLLAFLHSTSQEKLNYLRNPVRNGLAMPDLQPEEAVALARIVRDLSAEEANFLVRSFSFKRIQLGKGTGQDTPDALVIPLGGREELIATGLISLGLILPAGPTLDDSGLMRFSNVVAKVIALLREPSA